MKPLTYRCRISPMNLKISHNGQNTSQMGLSHASSGLSNLNIERHKCCRRMRALNKIIQKRGGKLKAGVTVKDRSAIRSAFARSDVASVSASCCHYSDSSEPSAFSRQSCTIPRCQCGPEDLVKVKGGLCMLKNLARECR